MQHYIPVDDSDEVALEEENEIQHLQITYETAIQYLGQLQYYFMQMDITGPPSAKSDLIDMRRSVEAAQVEQKFLKPQQKLTRFFQPVTAAENSGFSKE